MKMKISPEGEVTCIYTEAIDLPEIGKITEIKRASHVEPTALMQSIGWTSDMSPVGGPVLGPFDNRQDALTAEVEWLERGM